jgi:hypothetical protein
MIAFRENGNSYYVTNTLLNRMSNETMLAIAKGLKPLSGTKSEMKEPLGVIGAGWVGLVTAACFADLGHEVVVRDVVPERIAELEAGRVPIYEPGLPSSWPRNRERIRYTLDMADVFDARRMAFVASDTPRRIPATPTSPCLASGGRATRAGRADRAIMKSTVPVGTGAMVRDGSTRAGLAHVGYVSNPEFLAEAAALDDFRSQTASSSGRSPRRRRRRRRALRVHEPRSCAQTSPRRRWSRWPRTPSSPRSISSSTRSQTCAR